MPKLIITRGIQGSGKSTWAINWAKEDPTHRVRWNNDDARKMMGEYWVPERENTKVLDIMKEAFIKRMMACGYDIIIDDMNLNPKTVDKINNIVNEQNEILGTSYSTEFKDFFISVEECIRRDAMRPNPIGAAVIRQTWNRYRNMICSLENKRVYERVKSPNNDLENAVIFDLDATLAFNVTNRPFFGPGCAEGIVNDLPNVPIVNMVKAYHKAGYHILIVTGREGTEAIKSSTIEWLNKYEVPFESITWRSTGDHSKGQDYKLRMINLLSNQYNIELVVDDSQKIVDVLRDNGYTVLQPNEGKF